MSYEIINIVLVIIGLIIALGGGIAGFISVYILWKKSKAKLKIIMTKANYFLDKKDLIINVVINLRNEKETPQAITDLVASIRFDPKKKNKGMPLGLSVSPIFSSEFPITIPANSAQSINLRFVFPGGKIEAIDRIGEARFIGIHKNTPILVSDERDFQKKWKDLPLFLRLDLHVNGADSIKTITGAYKTKKMEILSGTFNSLDIGKIQHEFMKGWKI